MAQQQMAVNSMNEALAVLSENIVPLLESDFGPLGEYVHPLRSQVPVVLELESGRNPIRIPLTTEEGVITSLYLADEWELFERLRPDYGSLEHGGWERQLGASCNKSDQRYLNNVLRRFRVKTGEMGVKTPEGHEFYKVVGITPRQISPPIVFDDRVQALKSLSGDYTYTLARKSKIPVPSRGPYSRIGDTDGKGYWNGVFCEDNEGRSAVRCCWDSDVQGLYADAGRRPVDGRCRHLGDDDAVGTWRKAT